MFHKDLFTNSLIIIVLNICKTRNEEALSYFILLLISMERLDLLESIRTSMSNVLPLSIFWFDTCIDSIMREEGVLLSYEDINHILLDAGLTDYKVCEGEVQVGKDSFSYLRKHNITSVTYNEELN